MVDMALTWFGYVWIGSFVVLNLIAVVPLIVAPSLWLGLAKLVEIYSPLNLSLELLNLAPSRRRCSRSPGRNAERGAPPSDFPSSGSAPSSSILITPISLPTWRVETPVRCHISRAPSASTERRRHTVKPGGP